MSIEAESSHGLGLLIRLYIYAIHGYVAEVMFTALWEFVVDTNWKLAGCTSVWSLLIYGVSLYVIERVYLRLQDSTRLPVRGLIYLTWSYGWEFSTGWLLRKFNACPWDYTDFKWHFNGLITLEYCPLWYFAAMAAEQCVIKTVLSLRWNDRHEVNKKF